MNQEYVVIIQDWTEKGHGLAVIETNQEKLKRAEVPYAVPGDQYRVELMRRKKKGLYQTYPLERLQDSPLRCQPKCLHFEECGGCRWQQISYEKQLEIKQGRIAQLFEKSLQEGGELFSMIPCSSMWAYRNKMEYTFSQNREGDRFLGLVKVGGKGRAINLSECYLTAPWFLKACDLTREWWESADVSAFSTYRNEGVLRTLTVREGFHTQDRMVMLTVSGNPKDAITKEKVMQWSEMMQKYLTPSEPEAHLGVFLQVQQAIKGTPTRFYEFHLSGPDCMMEKLKISTQNGIQEVSFRISPTAFFQPNTQQAERIYQRALELAELSKEMVVYDLYCGTGSIGLFASHFVKEVIGIELHPESIVDGKENIKNNQVNNMVLHQGDVGQILSELYNQNSSKPDVVILDPPRVGLDKKAIENVLRLSPKKIIYISCNPKTQAADTEIFNQSGYNIQCIQPIDQFPQTVHVENIVILHRVESGHK